MMKEETTYHIPVLLMPSVDAMSIRPDGTYVDVTFGGGGHSREILSRLEDGELRTSLPVKNTYYKKEKKQ